jgi:hypothetical protein
MQFLQYWVQWYHLHRTTVTIQGVPGVKVTTLGVTSLGDAESKTSYTHGSNLQRFRSSEVWKKLERKEEHCAFIEKYSYRFGFV